jgi:UDP-glucose 4-epimerase
VIVLDNLSNSSEELKRVQELTGKTLKFIQGDIRNQSDLDQAFLPIALMQ